MIKIDEEVVCVRPFFLRVFSNICGMVDTWSMVDLPSLKPHLQGLINLLTVIFSLAHNTDDKSLYAI